MNLPSISVLARHRTIVSTDGDMTVMAGSSNWTQSRVTLQPTGPGPATSTKTELERSPQPLKTTRIFGRCNKLVAWTKCAMYLFVRVIAAVKMAWTTRASC